ncbi:MAG: DUF763 domain-containing protein [Spirochaetes bacterium]|nr:DUF763 domain-containing protein [Spirochaetota bacterium]
MNRTGYTDLPLHGGRVPQWLAERMARLGGAVVEAIVEDYGRKEVLRRLSDPFWFQAFGALLGMDWHSSGITTSVMGALKRALHHSSARLGIYICGGRGRHSRNTPRELLAVAEGTGLDGDGLVRCSRLSARVDNNAMQDGYQLYQHSFIVTEEGDWAVVQQGMNTVTGLARRYHWLSSSVRSFVEEPHASIYGENQGTILNLVDRRAGLARKGIADLASERPEKTLDEVRRLVMPAHHDVRPGDVNMKRLGAALALAYERDLRDFESLLLLEGVGPRTVQSLALVSEAIHGTPIRFSDPARFSFAHGGKDGHPFPVKLSVYDETIQFMEKTVSRARIGIADRQRALRSLAENLERIEQFNEPEAHFGQAMMKERRESARYGGRTAFDDRKRKKRKPKGPDDSGQMNLF